MRFTVTLQLDLRFDTREELNTWLDAITGNDHVITADQMVADRARVENTSETLEDVKGNAALSYRDFPGGKPWQSPQTLQKERQEQSSSGGGLRIHPNLEAAQAQARIRELRAELDRLAADLDPTPPRAA